ncbi:hypothetical protein N510_000966 [Firmicutes bacterium ASF500]|nr:hypothetical protein N510_000966 [Firmicutes bacterium ASF500]
MVQKKKWNTAWRAVLFTVCGGVLLLVLLLMLILRYHAMEIELDRMLTESLTAHTTEAGEGAGYLLHYAETALKNAGLLIQEDARSPDKSWVVPMVETFNLVDNRMELSYLDREDMLSSHWGGQDPELLDRVLRGEAVVSQALGGPQMKGIYIIAARPLTWEGVTVGALLARIEASTLLHQGTHSTFFHSVNSVIASGDGQVVYGSSPDTSGVSLVDLGAENGITEQEAKVFTAAYQEEETGSFRYEPAGGRFYVAWAPVGYHGWRVVQFSQSPSVKIDHSTTVQTTVMLISLAVCAILAVLAWRQRSRLAEEKMRYNKLAQFRDTLLFEYNVKDDSLEFTSNALDSLELKSLRLTGVTNKANSFSVFHPDDMEHVQHILRSAGQMSEGQIEHDRIRLKKQGGEYNWYRSQYKAIYGPDGHVEQVIGTLTDISTQIVREIELRKQAQLDPLTGLYNRAGVKLINARLEQISRGVLFMMDLDDFKSVNDSFGHAAGDQLLTAIAGILTETFRADDIVARVGGDEFVAFLSGSDSRRLSEQKGQELLERVRNLRLEGMDIRASVSIGAAGAPTYGSTYEELSAVADEALYEVKNKGKGGFCLK